MQVVATTPGITWEAATGAVQAAVRHAERRGWRINAAVVDRGGNLMAFLRMPEASLFSSQTAMDKAYSAASARMPMLSYRGFCPDCAAVAPTTSSAGHVDFSFDGARAGSALTALDQWQRGSVPIVPLSEAVVHPAQY